jgi:hypothetical protein
MEIPKDPFVSFDVFVKIRVKIRLDNIKSIRVIRIFAKFALDSPSHQAITTITKEKK